MENNRKCTTAIAFGRPGVGKSTLGDHLLYNDWENNTFNAEDNPMVYSVTTKIQIEEIKYIDFPGAGDLTQSPEDYVKQLQNQLLNVPINVALLLVTGYDNRINFPETHAALVLKNIFEIASDQQNKSDLIWLVFTNCQQIPVSQKFIDQKVQYFQSLGLEIKRDHVICYNRVQNQLNDFQPIFDKIDQSQNQLELRICKDVQKCLQKCVEEINKDDKQVQAYKEHVASQEQEIKRLKDRPTQIINHYHTTRKNCNIF